MALTNLLKKQVDQPVFEWMRFTPVSTATTNALIGMDGLTGERYLYFVDFSGNFRYDTWSDSWEQISPLQTALSSNAKGKVSKFHGNYGHIISATSTTVQIGGWGRSTKNSIGYKIRIVSGLGAGQERTITAVSDPVIEDNGTTSSASSVSITDSTKKWRFNQWDSYSCRILHSSTSSTLNQARKILYNNQTSLTFVDANLQMIDSFNNTGFNINSPPTFNSPGTNTQYVIESVTITVDSPWTVTPDGSSTYMIMTGGLFFISTTGSQTLLPQYYDIASDIWYTKTGIGSGTHYASGLNSYPFALIDESSGVLISGVTATSATARSLVNTGASMEYDRYTNHEIRIVSGTGIGQKRRIVAHGATFMHIERNWDITPDSTSSYQIWPDTDKLYLNGAAQSATYQYSIAADLWASGQIIDYGISRNISATPYAGTSYGAPHQGYGVSSIVRTTTGILSGAVNAGGTNYLVGDLVTCSTTGSNGTFYVTSVSSTGAVTGLQLAASGTGYSAGSSNTTGGSGSGLTITLTVGTTALVTTATNHDFRSYGTEQIRIAGCTTDTSFNAVFTILGVGSLTSFSIAAPASSASPTAASTQSTTLLVDAEKNWTVNEHVGRVLFTYSTTGTNPTSMSGRRITSNTATTITVSTSITTPTNGTDRYVICDVHSLGAMETYRAPTKKPTGWVSSATATTLVDSTKNWDFNQWQNCRVRITAGTGIGSEAAISSNSSTTLTVASWPNGTPDATSKYEIMDSYGIATSGSFGTLNDTAKKWPTNLLVGKRLRIVAGTAIGNEATITANTATSITAAVGTPDSTSVYVIYENVPRLFTAEKFDWLFGLSDTTKKGRWIMSSAGSNSTMGQFDIFDIPSNTWENNVYTSPTGIGIFTGTMFAYDGADTLFFTVSATGRLHALNLATMTIDGAGNTPYAHGTALSRSGMQVITTDDGLKYVYVQRHTGQEMWRTLKFW
jgi:hypothetical protein